MNLKNDPNIVIFSHRQLSIEHKLRIPEFTNLIRVSVSNPVQKFRRLLGLLGYFFPVNDKLCRNLLKMGQRQSRTGPTRRRTISASLQQLSGRLTDIVIVVIGLYVYPSWVGDKLFTAGHLRLLNR